MQIHPAHAPHSVPALPPHPATLHVVTCVTNFSRFASRGRLYRSFAKHVDDSGAVLWTVEAQLHTRPFEAVEAGDLHHIAVRTETELWLKENLMNVAAARLPQDAEYIAFVDADFSFSRSDWAHETVQQLQHCKAVQMFSCIGQLGPNEEIVSSSPGFVEAWMSGVPIHVGAVGSGKFAAKGTQFHQRKGGPGGHGYGGTFGPPGGAWAYRREALDALGGLIDYCVLGSADFFMALGLVGLMQHRIPAGYSPGLKRRLLAWQANAERELRRNVGVVPGTALHHWHGPFSGRNYDTRERILCKHQFDPDTDLRYNTQGVVQLVDDGTERAHRLRDDVRGYFAVRNEDDVRL